jgi:hypothetical protein
MKKFICTLATLALLAPLSWADEGMWLLPLIQKMNSKALKEAGCKLTPKEIYDINHSSLKDAIVQFGGGCTGEVVSSEGLLLTNHHCGYGNIQKLSSVEHDYLKDGFWAMTRDEELPCSGLTVTFLEGMNDVTEAADKLYEEAFKELGDKDQSTAKMLEGLQEMAKAFEKSKPHCRTIVKSFYNDNIWYLITYKTYKDIRFVGAPPSSIGKFGADTDNWMWPRHTGDFSIFRIYADKDGNPAEYSKDNVPYKAPRHLKVSTKGIQEGDYTMIMGYPGRTTRFQTSPELELQITTNDIRIAARTLKQQSWMEDMLADPKIKIQYASKYAGSSNGWKKWQGMKLAFGKLDIIERAKEEEKAFTEWANSTPELAAKYGKAIEMISKGVAATKKGSLHSIKITESLYSIELINTAWTARNTVLSQIRNGKDSLEAATFVAERLASKYKDYSMPTDQKTAKVLIKFYKDSTKDTEDPTGFKEKLAKMNIDEYVDLLFASSIFTSEQKLKEAVASKGAQAILEDPALEIGNAMNEQVQLYSKELAEGEKLLAEGRKLYTGGLLEWKAGEAMYPDANFTMRLTYGRVLPYSPKNGVNYWYYTTLEGVMEKEDPNNWEFVVPAKLKELYEAKDFGPYAMKDGRMPVAFLSNNDITGGNSGSPVMNAKGELIGLAFDGNWESMSSDVMFEPELQRCINVDIRYVLFIIDKFGGAKHLVDEMTIVK